MHITLDPHANRASARRCLAVAVTGNTSTLDRRRARLTTAPAAAPGAGSHSTPDTEPQGPQDTAPTDQADSRAPSAPSRTHRPIRQNNRQQTYARTTSPRCVRYLWDLLSVPDDPDIQRPGDGGLARLLGRPVINEFAQLAGRPTAHMPRAAFPSQDLEQVLYVSWTIIEERCSREGRRLPQTSIRPASRREAGNRAWDLLRIFEGKAPRGDKPDVVFLPEHGHRIVSAGADRELSMGRLAADTISTLATHHIIGGDP